MSRSGFPSCGRCRGVYGTLPGTTLAASATWCTCALRAMIGGEQSGADAAAEVAGEVGEAGDLVGLARGDADVVERADGDEDEGQSDDLEHAPERDCAEAGVEVEPREVVDAERGGDVAESTPSGAGPSCRVSGRRRAS